MARFLLNQAIMLGDLEWVTEILEDHPDLLNPEIFQLALINKKLDIANYIYLSLTRRGIDPITEMLESYNELYLIAVIKDDLPMFKTLFYFLPPNQLIRSAINKQKPPEISKFFNTCQLCGN